MGFLAGTGAFWAGIGPRYGPAFLSKRGRGVWVGQIGYGVGLVRVFGRLVVSYTVYGLTVLPLLVAGIGVFC